MRRPYLFTIVVIILGILSAVLADTFLKERIAIIGDFAGLRYSLNPGIAFGITMPSLLQSFFILLALVVIGYIWISKHHSKLAQYGYALIIGGGLANIVDRVRDGFVTDYFQVGTFPIFNVPDSCVTIGVGLLLLDAVFFSKTR